MSIDISKFHATFFEESLENLDAMEAGLLSLEGAATQDPETINTIFRAAHSIRGARAPSALQNWPASRTCWRPCWTRSETASGPMSRKSPTCCCNP